MQATHLIQDVIWRRDKRRENRHNAAGLLSRLLKRSHRQVSKAAYTLALLIASIAAAQAQDTSSAFPRPESLHAAIRFWTRVYTEIETTEGFVHDSENLAVVYERLDIPPSARQRRRLTRNTIEKYRDILSKLASGSRSDLGTEDARVLSLWPDDTSDAELQRASRRLRFQLGQADRFRAGLRRSGQWRSYIREALKRKGVPVELAALPHVESSFDPTAYSKVGAAGMWQFTRSTGARYMQIDHIVDERRDPFISTVAAAQLLHDNYSVIQSWPLAITAYNHGLSGMRRAVRQQKTDDIGVIVHNYTSRTFGFASRNFYAAFLAALDVDKNAERFFGPTNLNASDDSIVVQLSDYIDVDSLVGVVDASRSELRALNPALMDTVWAGDKFVPKGFELRLPASVGTDPSNLLAAIPDAERYAAQRPDEYHRVRRGETLSEIAEQYRISLAALTRANNLRSRNFIRVGQLITLPVAGAKTPVSRVQSATEAIPSDGQYIVRRGDSVDRIARRFQLNEAQLLSANNVANRNRIYVGQVLQIPTASAYASEAKPDIQANTQLADESILLADATTPIDEPDDLVDRLLAEPTATVTSVINTHPAAFALVSQQADSLGDSIGVGVDIYTTEAPVESNALESEQAQLAADPSDYSVADNGTIEVHAQETLGHYADWLQVRTQRLRDVNSMPFRQAVVLGQRIRLDFSAVDAERFERLRIAYQADLQESFFSAYQIADIDNHIVRTGESLFLLAHRTYKVPVWLLRQYNPDLDLDRVNPGTVVKFPRLQPIGG